METQRKWIARVVSTHDCTSGGPQPPAPSLRAELRPELVTGHHHAVKGGEEKMPPRTAGPPAKRTQSLANDLPGLTEMRNSEREIERQARHILRGGAELQTILPSFNFRAAKRQFALWHIINIGTVNERPK
ncbi:Urease accessory protein UreG [Frankliniella fusca]|uniref:Urease accessory protein UreG n=1 Tax=Frankliniella fusca TaxID=407009 RepID=A0AAE1IVZ3_9NEOP|nr:Urease accessory protein UreG [Frankliniella fusca]